MTLLDELGETIAMLEAEIPANPNANESLEDAMARDLRKYFKALENALSMEQLEEFYYKMMSRG